MLCAVATGWYLQLLMDMKKLTQVRRLVAQQMIVSLWIADVIYNANLSESDTAGCCC
jgi:hypothetical protein